MAGMTDAEAQFVVFDDPEYSPWPELCEDDTKDA